VVALFSREPMLLNAERGFAIPASRNILAKREIGSGEIASVPELFRR
jgi:hypothetical protein